ncbi:MAG: nuclear transport factor 2 family protein [Nocardioides sp.]
MKPLGSVAGDPAHVLDRLLIHEAFDRWAIGHDECRVDVVLSVLTDDVVLEYGIGSAEPDFAIRGRDEVENRLGRNFPNMTGQRRHCVTNVLIESLTPATATAIAYGIVTRAADGYDLHATVLYRGELRKEADGFWRFSRYFVGCDDLRQDAGPRLEDQADPQEGNG